MTSQDYVIILLPGRVPPIPLYLGDVNLTTVDGFLLPLSMGQRRIFEMSHVIHFKDRKGSQIQTVGHIT